VAHQVQDRLHYLQHLVACLPSIHCWTLRPISVFAFIWLNCLFPLVRTCFGFHSFAVAAIIIWNSFPLAVCCNVSTHSSQRQLNTYIYISRYSHLSSLLNTLYACQQAPQIWQDVCWHCALYKFTYEEVGIVFDQYLSGSLKETTFKKRMIKTSPVHYHMVMIT